MRELVQPVGWPVKITRRLEKLVDIRGGEYRKTALMFLYLFLLIASYVTIKAVRDALFLNELGAAQLPYVYILIAVLVGAVAGMYAKVSGGIGLSTLIHFTLLVVIVSLVGFWWVLPHQWPWLYYALYIWASLVGILTTTQCWLLANHMFNAREAKRLFGVIGAGAILGGITGGILTAGMVSFLGTEAMLLVSAVGYLLCSGLVALIGRVPVSLGQGTPHGSEPTVVHSESSSTHESILGPLRTSRHLRTLAAIIGLTVLVSTLVDFQFKAIASESFPTKDALTAFMGTFMASLSALSFVLQLFFTGRILKSLGLGLALIFLPVGLLLGSLAIAVAPGLISGIIVKLSDGTFRYSINKAGIELLYLPVPWDVKKRTKAFIDTVVDRVARGLGGVILLVATGLLALSVAQISLISISLLSLWIFLTIITQKEYLNSLRRALHRKQVDLTSTVLTLTEPGTVEILTRSLLRSNEAGALYILNLLEGADMTPYVPALQEVVQRGSSEVRAKAVRVLAETSNPDLIPWMTEMVRDTETGIQVEAIRFVCKHSTQPEVHIEGWLADPDPRIASAAIVCVMNDAGEGMRAKIKPMLTAMVRDRGQRGVERRREAAKALGWITPYSASHDDLILLLQDDAVEVVRDAVKSAGRIQKVECVPQLVRLLHRKEIRDEVRAALLRFGPSILPTLANFLENELEPMEVRRILPGIIGQIGTGEAVEILQRYLDEADTQLRYQTLKALNKLRARDPVIMPDTDLTHNRLINEIRCHYELLLMVHDPSFAGDGPGTRLLRKALQERLDHNLEIIFRLLGLLFSIKDVHNAYVGLKATDAQIRANAVEFLDTLLPSTLKQYLIPIIDERSLETALEGGPKFFSLTWSSQEELLMQLIQGTDPWLKTCAVYVVGERNISSLVDQLRYAVQEPHPMVRETARLALERMGQVGT